MDKPRVIVQPPSRTGARRVRFDSEILGLAYSPEDVVEFLCRAGLDPNAVRLDDLTLIEWRGGGPDYWPPRMM